MSYDIVIVRDGDAYRLLHGHLRLATVLDQADEVLVNVPGEGRVRISRARNEYYVRGEAHRLPLHRQ